MQIYILTIATSCLAAYLSSFEKQYFISTKKKKIKLMNLGMVVSSLIPLVIAGIRYDVGTDYMAYKIKQIPFVLNNLQNTGRDDIVEPLYKLIIRVSAWLGNDQWVFFFTHLIIISVIFLVINKESKVIVLSVLVFYLVGFYPFSLNIMRQSIAISIFIFSLHYIFDRDILRFLCSILIASLFHKTALLYVFTYFIFGFNFQKKRWVFFLPILASLSYPMRAVFEYIALFIGRYASYFNSKYDSSFVGYPMLILNLAIFLFFIYCSTQNLTSDKVASFYIHIQIISFVLCLWSPVIPNPTRIVYMFMTVAILSIPYFFYKTTRKSKKLILILLLVIMSAYFVDKFLINNSGDILPYKTIISS